MIINAILAVVSIVAIVVAIFYINLLHSEWKYTKSNYDEIQFQKKVTSRLHDFGFHNQGDSLDECKIYFIPYKNTGYPEVQK